ncbi:MAG: amidohydrolase family protein [Saprospiraceae bacterium]|nr:amidohydrolase family protein [Candidatus Vicinibacter proximus]MCC6841998.1 amidohydrolase family protein [Saprospiraceae bacterium]
MLKVYSDHIFNGFEFLKQTGLIFNDKSEIVKICPIGSFDKSEFNYYPGLLVPGFVNAHCHLELSHLRNKVGSGIGLLPFLKNVVGLRETSEEEIQVAIRNADAQMYELGIVAVGDISNKPDTIVCKSESRIKYFNFIESFDFMQEHLTNFFFNGYLETFKKYGNLPKSMVPHAPYSVTPQLFKLINHQNCDPTVISIHNQEVMDEDLLFLSKQGGFLDFYQHFGFNLDTFLPTGKTSIHYTLSHLDLKHNVLLVHNTMMGLDDIIEAKNRISQIYFVTCPNANLYIENNLPDYKYFIETGSTMCIGTDSLSSNWSLSILDEIKTIHKYNQWIPLQSIFSWATINGARALKMDDCFGSFEIHKSPGLNWIQEFKRIDEIAILPQSAGVKKIL